jgi:hypothetical protein
VGGGRQSPGILILNCFDGRLTKTFPLIMRQKSILLGPPTPHSKSTASRGGGRWSLVSGVVESNIDLSSLERGATRQTTTLNLKKFIRMYQ